MAPLRLVYLGGFDGLRLDFEDLGGFCCLAPSDPTQPCDQDPEVKP